MPVAISVPVPGPLRDSIDYAREAEQLGYGEAWLAEVSGPDAFSLAGALAVATGLRIGTAVVPIYNRTPMVLAMTAASLGQLSGGRFVLGIGTSSENIVDRWNGVPFEQPYTRMRETLEVLKRLLAGEKVTYHGETIRLDGYRVTVEGAETPKVYIAALNRRMLRLAGEMADGVILNMLAPEHLPLVLGEVAEGARAAGRDPSEIESIARVHVVYDQPFEVGAAVVKGVFGAYAATSVYNRFFRWLGFEDEAARISEAWEARDRDALSAAVSDRLVRTMAVVGSAEECRSTIQAYLDHGLDVAALNPLTLSIEDARRMMQELAPGS